MAHEDRDAAVDAIIKEPIDMIHSLHGIAGLDRALEFVQERIKTEVFTEEQQSKDAHS